MDKKQERTGSNTSFSFLVDCSSNEIHDVWAGNKSLFLQPENHAQDNRLNDYLREASRIYLKGHLGLSTSGSTGDPILVVGTKRRCSALIDEIHKAQQCESVKETVCLLPLSYSFALVNQRLWALAKSAEFWATEGFCNPGKLVKALASSNNGMTCLVASHIPLFRQLVGNATFKGIRRVNFAGDRFPQQDLPYIRNLFPSAEIFNNYGCTEAMPRLTIRHADDSDDASNIGRPLPGIELRADEEGRLLFRSPYGAVATISEDGLKRIGPDDWVETGDFGEQCADGTWRVLGRTNSVFKRFGEKVSVSRVVDELRGAWDGEIVGYTGEDPAGAPGWSLVLAPEPAGEEVRKILLALREAYTRPHWPIRIESMASLPRLPNGKIDLQALKDAENKKLHWRQRI